MSLNLNQIHIAGNLTKEPELKRVAEKDLCKLSVCKLSVAVNERWTSKTGEKKENTTYFDIDVWGNAAAACAKYLAKGKPVYVQGKMVSQKTEKDGVTRTFWSVKADSVQFLGTGNQTTTAETPRAAAASAGAADDAEPPF